MILKKYANLKLNLFKYFFKPMKSKKIVHIFKIRKGYAGEYVGLGVSSDLTNKYLNELGFNSLAYGVIDDNRIDKILHDERPDFLIIKAFWVRKEKLELLANKYKKTTFIVVSHSKPTFLGTETKGFEKLFEVINLAKKFDNILLGVNNYDFISNLESITDKCVYVPNIVLPEDIKKDFTPSNEINIGLFCAIRPMKNILNSALAAISAAEALDKKLNLYVITNRVEMGGDITLKNLRDLFNNLDKTKYELIELDWMNHGDFNEKIRTMDLGLQVSFTETFNIVGIDFLNNNVPVITSPSITWASTLSQANPDDITEIKDKIISHYDSDCVRQWSMGESYLKLMNYNINGALAYNALLGDYSTK